IVKARKHSQCRKICVDAILLLLQLMFTITGILVGIVNASGTDSKCTVKTTTNRYPITTHGITTTVLYSYEYDALNIEGPCIGVTFLFAFSILLLFIRCWILPPMETLKKARKGRLVRGI